MTDAHLLYNIRVTHRLKMKQDNTEWDIQSSDTGLKSESQRSILEVKFGLCHWFVVGFLLSSATWSGLLVSHGTEHPAYY